VDGDTYVPGTVMDDVAKEAGFEWECGDLELGDL
jgi:hypothetical protein